MPGCPGFAPGWYVAGPRLATCAGSRCRGRPQASAPRAVSDTFLCSRPSPGCLLYSEACGSHARPQLPFLGCLILQQGRGWGSLCSWASAALDREAQQTPDGSQTGSSVPVWLETPPPPQTVGLPAPSGHEGRSVVREG